MILSVFIKNNNYPDQPGFLFECLSPDQKKVFVFSSALEILEISTRLTQKPGYEHILKIDLPI